jgi:hypothetical protein
MALIKNFKNWFEHGFKKPLKEFSTTLSPRRNRQAGWRRLCPYLIKYMIIVILSTSAGAGDGGRVFASTRVPGRGSARAWTTGADIHKK